MGAGPMSRDETIREQVERVLLADGGGMIPCSRYGRHTDDLLDLVDFYAHVCAAANGRDDVTDDTLHAFIGLAVNDSDQVQSIVLEDATPDNVADLLDYFDRDYIGAEDQAEFRDGYIAAALFADAYREGPDGPETADIDPMLYNVSGIPTFNERDFIDGWDDIVSDVNDLLDTIGVYVAATIARRDWYSWREAGADAWLSSHEHGTGFWDRGIGTWGEKLHAVTPRSGAMILVTGENDDLTYTS